MPVDGGLSFGRGSWYIAGMEDTNLDEQKQLALQIREHTDKANDLFREGLAIHDEYQAAPEGRSLTDEVAAFLEKSNAGIAEMNEANELQKLLNIIQRDDIAEQTAKLNRLK